MKVTWQKFGWVEAQLFKADVATHGAILFCPGFPGMGAAIFEQRHASALTHEGYDVYVIHHKGTRTDRAMSAASINNGKRIQDAWERGETHLGGGAVTMDELIAEPVPVLQELAAQYESIHVVGNSFGALSSLWCLTEEGAPVNKIKSLVLLAGAQGVDDGSEMCAMNRVWKKEFLEFPRITDQLDVKDTDGAIVTLRKVYRELPERVSKRLPEAIPMTYVVVEKDEILKLSDTESFQKAIGGRGIIVMEQDEGWPAYGITPHYTANLRTSKILKWIRGLYER